MFEKALVSLAPPSEPVKQPPPELALLTPRGMDVLRLIASGANNREIAQTLFLSENTVKNYVTNILSHLNLRDRRFSQGETPRANATALRYRTQAALLAHSLFKEHSA